jgi:hypothetical protein
MIPIISFLYAIVISLGANAQINTQEAKEDLLLKNLKANQLSIHILSFENLRTLSSDVELVAFEGKIVSLLGSEIPSRRSPFCAIRARPWGKWQEPDGDKNLKVFSIKESRYEGGMGVEVLSEDAKLSIVCQNLTGERFRFSVLKSTLEGILEIVIE